jgi:hypothetical protein
VNGFAHLGKLNKYCFPGAFFQILYLRMCLVVKLLPCIASELWILKGSDDDM